MSEAQAKGGWWSTKRTVIVALIMIMVSVYMAFVHKSLPASDSSNTAVGTEVVEVTKNVFTDAVGAVQNFISPKYSPERALKKCTRDSLCEYQRVQVGAVKGVLDKIGYDVYFINLSGQSVDVTLRERGAVTQSFVLSNTETIQAGSFEAVRSLPATFEFSSGLGVM
jgi:hypothetical protein